MDLSIDPQNHPLQRPPNPFTPRSWVLQASIPSPWSPFINAPASRLKKSCQGHKKQMPIRFTLTFQLGRKDRGTNLTPPHVIKKILASALGLALTLTPSLAQNWTEKLNTPLQVALVNPIQIFRQDYDVSGIRLNLIYGKNTNVSGVDLGLVNFTSSKQEGLQVGVFNFVGDELTGGQIGFVNRATAHSSGVQVGFLCNLSQTNLTGYQSGSINLVNGDFHGFQSGELLNVIKGNGVGVQASLFNFAHGNFDGLQIGLINTAQSLRGVQIGLININSSSNYMSFFPFINMAF
jgi:hypothetical protein